MNKINVTKCALFLLLHVPTHHSFTFNLQFLYERKCMVHLSETVHGIFHFWYRLVFVNVHIFVQKKNKKNRGIDDAIIPFQSKNNKKVTLNFARRPLIFK